VPEQVFPGYVRASICLSRNASHRHPYRRLGIEFISYSLPSVERRR